MRVTTIGRTPAPTSSYSCRFCNSWASLAVLQSPGAWSGRARLLRIFGDVTGVVWDVAFGVSATARGGAIGERDGDASGAAGADECLSVGCLEEDGRAARVTITSDVAAVCLASPGAAKLPRGVFALEHTAPMAVYSEISAGRLCATARRAERQKRGARKNIGRRSVSGSEENLATGSRRGERIV